MIGIINKKGKKYDYLSSYVVEDVFSLIECEKMIKI